MDTPSEDMNIENTREDDIRLLFNTHVDMAKRHARNWVATNRLPQHITYADAQQAAAEAAWEAANKYAEELCDKFGPFMMQQVQFKLRNLWRSGSGGHLLGGVHTREDNKATGVTVNTNNFNAEFVTDAGELEALDYSPAIAEEIAKMGVDSGNDFIDAAYDFEGNARLLSSSAKHLLELSHVGGIKASQTCALHAVKVNLQAADKSDLGDADKARLLGRCDKPGAGCELFAAVAPVMHEGARRDAVRAAARLYSQKWLSFLFAKSKALISGYADGSKTASPELAGVCRKLATGAMSLDDVLSCRWKGVAGDGRPVLTARCKSTVVNEPPATLNLAYVQHLWMRKHHPGEITRQRKGFLHTMFNNPARSDSFVEEPDGDLSAYKLTSTAVRHDYNTVCGFRHGAARAAYEAAESGETYRYGWLCTCCIALRGVASATKK